MRWSALLLATSCTGCGSDSPKVSAENVAEQYTTVGVDDSIGIACAMYSHDEPCGKSVCSETVIGPCFPTSQIPAWLATSDRTAFDAFDAIGAFVVDDTNGLVCIAPDGSTISNCFSQLDLVAEGVATLRAQVSP
jgi:hypothetical protein